VGERSHTSDIVEGDSDESTLLEYVRFSVQQQPRLPFHINDACRRRARIRNEFPDAPAKSPRLSSSFFARGRWALPAASSDEPAARKSPKTQHRAALGGWSRAFWSSFRTSRDFGHRGPDAPARAAVRQVLALNRDERVAFRSTASRSGKGKISLPALGARNVHCSITICDWNGPIPFRRAVRLTQRTRARTRMTAAGLRSLFASIARPPAQPLPPHRFRHTFASDMIRAGMSLPALMQLMGHATSNHAALCVGHPQTLLP